MRACKIALVESSTPVSRLLLDPLDRTVAAAILSDNQSTCILLPLNHHQQPKHLRLKSPPCTDACFLRLELGSSSKSATFNAGVKQAEAPLQFGQFAEPESELGRSFFLVASPGLGSTCTDIRAWSSESFRPVHLEAGVVGVSREGGTCGIFARFEIPPSEVKMVASVNLVAVYSPSVAKVWVFGVRAQSKAGKQSLLLLNCSVVDCGEAVSTMHASKQHLVMSGEFGVRVLPLRPLVKGRKVCQVVKYVHGSCSPRLNGLHEKEGLKNGYVCESNDKESGRNGMIKHQLSTVVYCHLESTVQQAVSVHALTEKTFILLDSVGVLHALMLKTRPAVFKREAGGAVELDVKTLRLPFPVSALSIVPSSTDAGAARTMWVTDGENSIYVISVSEEMLADDETIVPPVMQVVFTGSRIDLLYAISAETVLALSEGTLIAYVKAGG